MKDDKDRLKSIQLLSNEGKEKSCESELLLYLSEFSESITAHLMLGGLYFSQDKHGSAKPYLEYVLEHVPFEAQASVGLFHILWGEGQKNKAKNIMESFLENNQSQNPSSLATRADFKAIKTELIDKGMWENA